ncbi:Isopenicillin N synthase-like, Fe(2+) 2OG dioxygenase domain [Dillenia turbinata]|uniref:Isopenicillin N synthase-like, Fe(2+) 2OG dioxygenase domain n=1 Tax=Dillenia turbinata TaxID=194707 RepID=A0AAN8VI49_9MAGN
MGNIDPAFIQSIEHRPKLDSVEGDGIPLIDLSPLINSSEGLSNPQAIEGLIRQVGDACEKWGFFQVINHGVPLECRRKIEKAQREFFWKPLEEKLKVRRDLINPLGYYDTELTKNVRDWKEVFDFTVKEPTVIPASHEPGNSEVKHLTNQWPDHPSILREICQEYAGEMEKLAFKLLGLLSLSLGLPADRFNDFFKDQTSFIRLNHYPPCPSPDLALGVGRHKDGGALTILAQDDVGGLEVKRKSDGEWVRVWSNEKYVSVEHRVAVNSERERFSIPYFFNPGHYVMVKPIEELTTKQDPPKYKEYNWGKFFAHRRHTNFKKLDVENVQVSHFRISE